MLIARPFDRPVTIDETNLHYLAVPAWDRMLKLPHTERVALLGDPTARAELREAVEHYNRDPAKGTTVPPPLWDAVFVDEVVKPEHEKLQARSVREIADERGVTPADAMLDLALAEDLATRFRWRTESPEWTDAVREAQLDARMVIGVSDGGAHLARDDGADWSSYFLRWCIPSRTGRFHPKEADVSPRRGSWRQDPLTPLRSVRGSAAFRASATCQNRNCNSTIGPWKKEFVHDLPGGVGRFKAWGRGVHATIVNGEPIVLDGELTGRLPGHVLRPG